MDDEHLQRLIDRDALESRAQESRRNLRNSSPLMRPFWESQHALDLILLSRSRQSTLDTFLESFQ